jgi:carbamoyltransferase
LGPSNNYQLEKKAIDTLNKKKFKIYKNATNKKIATFIAKGKIVARCAGRMDPNQRALGNRSILADPRHLSIKEKINSAIKNRDFWMPFAPVILNRYSKKYLINPKNIESPHMTIGFKTTDLGYQKMKAACHPADKTARAQILNKKDNKNLYSLIEEFSKITGVGALLNTSFNLHGYPIVNSPRDALHVFKNSDLDALIFNNFFIIKK